MRCRGRSWQRPLSYPMVAENLRASPPRVTPSELREPRGSARTRPQDWPRFGPNFGQKSDKVGRCWGQTLAEVCKKAGPSVVNIGPHTQEAKALPRLAEFGPCFADVGPNRSKLTHVGQVRSKLAKCCPTLAAVGRRWPQRCWPQVWAKSGRNGPQVCPASARCWSNLGRVSAP